MQFQTRAEELAETFRNGNRKDVADEITQEQTPAIAAWLALAVAEFLTTHERRTLATMIENRAALSQIGQEPRK